MFGHYVNHYELVVNGQIVTTEPSTAMWPILSFYCSQWYLVCWSVLTMICLHDHCITFLAYWTLFEGRREIQQPTLNSSHTANNARVGLGLHLQGIQTVLCCNLMNVHFIKCLNELSNSAHLMCQNNSSPVHLAAFFRQKPITWTISTNLENVIQTQWEPKLIWGLKRGRTIIHSLEIFFI